MDKIIKNYTKFVKYLFPQLMDGIKLLISSEGRNITTTFERISDIDKNLLNERNKKFDEEIAFFAVN